ncbi:MAG TPA: DUF2207 domain-containing protein [Candidatus Saccharimonadales bacterium]
MKKVVAFILVGISLLLSAPPANAAVNDFTISRYDIEFNLGRDNEKRSTLTTKETIVADFPQSDQNHGIERYIPKEYNGHPASIDIKSVAGRSNILPAVGQDGRDWPYTTYDSGEYTVLRIGDKNKYVHGQQTFVITYTQRDVTQNFTNTNADEFYWDTNGTEWRVPIQSLFVKLTIDKSLEPSLTGKSACYQGRYGSNTACELTKNGLTYTASAANLQSGENMTLAVGFDSGTFSEYKMSLLEVLFIAWIVLQVTLGVLAFGIIVFLSVRYSRWSGRKGEVGTIVPEYIPPRDASVQVSATLVNSLSIFTAQLIDFAVRHYVKIFETKPKGLFSNAEYEIEIIKPIDDLRAEEQEILNDIFNGAIVGSKISTATLKKDYKLSTRIMDNPKKLQQLMRGSYGLRTRDEQKSQWFKQFGFIFLTASIVLLSPGLLLVAIVSLAMGYALWPLTDKGLALYRYLQGLKLYISVAEKERLKMLQSPEGAEKTQVDGNDKKQLVKLYERVLPYAILFGQEREWNKQIGNLYESIGTQPDWYTGANLAVFNAAAFSSAMNGLTTSISSSGAASSSSGGSSGGGSSGGGGGGGGGGGW